MRALRATDGSEPHLRAVRHHARRCRQKHDDAFFQGLQKEAEDKHQVLLLKVREGEDSAERLLDFTADIDGAEATLEDEIRNLSDDISKLDRKQPELNIYVKVFPAGTGGIINPERKKQIQPALDLIERLAAFKQIGAAQDALAKIQLGTMRLKDSLDAKANEEANFQRLFTQELALRGEVREHLVDVLARLTQRYKSNPSLAESFFIADARAGSTALSQAENRGRIFGKIEALFSFLGQKGLSLTEEQKKLISTTREEETVDVWLQQSFAGKTLAEIFPEPPKEV